jgi:tight adherence protein C
MERHLDRALARAGLREACEPMAWVAALLLCASFAAAFGALAVVWQGLPPFWIVVVATGAAWIMHSRLRLRAQARASAIAKELPAGIDLLVLCLEAGASLGAALRIASDKQGTGPMQQLWADVLAHVRAGLPRAAALRSVMERLDLPPVTALFTALIQADLRGMSLGAALRAQSTQCLADRFVRAERAALQAPVKLLLPLLTCIFPCTFIVIAVPIAARFIGVGDP